MLDLEYYKDQCEKLLDGNADLTEQVRALKKQTVPESLKAIAQLEEDFRVIEQLLIIIRRQTFYRDKVQDRIFLTLIDSALDVIYKSQEKET